MLAQALDVTDLQAALLDVETTAPIAWKLAVGEHVPVDEAASPEPRAARVRRAGDPVVQQPPARAE
jgi:hypothetical protein